jgi:hypothetical protein
VQALRIANNVPVMLWPEKTSDDGGGSKSKVRAETDI